MSLLAWKIVDTIVDNLQSRRGFDSLFDDLDPEVLAELMEDLENEVDLILPSELGKYT